MVDSLQDFKVLITRQPKFAVELTAMIEAKQGTCACVPLFDIESTINKQMQDNIVADLQRAYLGIFVSRNAAELVLPLLDKTADLYWATIGPITAKYLQQHGLTKILSPHTSPFDSAALVSHLKSMNINLANRLVMLFTGEDGLSWLAEELERQGAIVEVVTVYRRVIPEINSLPSFDIALISCVTSLKSLCTLNEKLSQSIIDTSLLVVSDRIRHKAIEMGFLKVYTAKSMSDVDILSALLYLRQGAIG